jgi:hypothetical protein
MQDANISNDLRWLAHGQVKARDYSRYDINGYRFQMVKLERTRPLVATSNIRVVTSCDTVFYMYLYSSSWFKFKIEFKSFL